MKTIANKKTVEFSQFKIEFENCPNGQAWFSVKELSGGTCTRPFGFVSIAELTELNKQLSVFLKENKIVSEFNKTIGRK